MNQPCWLCDIRAIESKRKPLCALCYTLCNKKNLLHIFPSFSNNSQKAMKAVSKYGYGLKEDMELLNSGETTLAEIGKKHGLSRERIKQMFPFFYDKPYTDVVLERKGANRAKAGEEKKKRKTMESRMERAKKNCPSYTGIVAENIFYQKCIALGYDVEMTSGTVDSTVNGHRVDVKSATLAKKMAGAVNQAYYHCHSRTKQYEQTNFYACYLYDIGIWYIIPKSFIRKQADGSGTIYIPKYDVEYNGYHRYKDFLPYREAWHLLATP